MFNGLYNCNTAAPFDACADYIGHGVYFTFVFINGKCLEWNQDFEEIQGLQALNG
jgi:hypothetical protein